MLIRSLEIDDMQSLANLYYAFWNEESNVQKMVEQFPNMKENYILLGCFEDNRLVGSVMGVVCMELYGECDPFLVVENMVIDKQFRRRGIGKMLFSALEARAKNKGCMQMILVTETNRQDACKFYESIGFHPTQNRGFKKKL